MIIESPFLYEPVNTVYTREQFTEYVKDYFNDGLITNPDGALWCPEENGKHVCKSFVVTHNIWKINGVHKPEYWDWCNSNTKGKVLCFWCDTENNRECWGFTDPEDIFLWMLRWT